MLVFRKDWLEIKQSKQLLVPIFVLPILMVVALPLIAVQIPVLMISGSGAGNTPLSATLTLPFEISALTAGMTAKQAFVYSMSAVFFAPFTMLVPLIVSSIISSDSFAGEKERKTVEALLASPLSDMELLLGKTLSFFRASDAGNGTFFLHLCRDNRLSRLSDVWTRDPAQFYLDSNSGRNCARVCDSGYRVNCDYLHPSRWNQGGTTGKRTPRDPHNCAALRPDHGSGPPRSEYFTYCACPNDNLGLHYSSDRSEAL